jgi:hypothetical protein
MERDSPEPGSLFDRNDACIFAAVLQHSVDLTQLQSLRDLENTLQCLRDNLPEPNQIRECLIRLHSYGMIEVVGRNVRATPRGVDLYAESKIKSEAPFTIVDNCLEALNTLPDVTVITAAPGTFASITEWNISNAACLNEWQGQWWGFKDFVRAVVDEIWKRK